VAVVRVSGPAAQNSLAALCPALPGKGRGESAGKAEGNSGEEEKKETAPPSHKLTLCKIINPDTGALIDHGMAVFFKGPASYTGDDTVEYHTHGSPAVITALLETLNKQPHHRMAEPGEFTRRAFENDKMDLTAAEAVADLIHAETEAQRLQALSQMGGALATLYDGWRENLARALAYLEADIDFPDEDLPDGVMEQTRPILEKLHTEIDNHLNDNRRGEILRDGVHVAVIGAPNAGKSSLVNALAQREVAIVSDIAGTTRDIIETHLNLGGYPVIISDTAGLRPEQLGNSDHDKIESEGIRRALARAHAADIKILLFDATAQTIDTHTQALMDEHSITVLNKIDQKKSNMPDALSVSVKTETGLDDVTNALVEKIKNIIGTRNIPSPTRARHRSALEECKESIIRALKAPQAELIAEDVRLSMRALGRITGRVDVEDLLDIIFRDFCIGK